MRIDSSSFLRWINIVGFIATILVNTLAANTTVIGGKITAQISDENPTLITPAGYVFSIWGVIYILLAIFVISQALPTDEAKKYREKIGWLFLISCILNIAWIFFWQFEFLKLSVIIIFLLLATLVLIYLRLDIGKTRIQLREKIVFHLPFSVYLAWITIASIANVAVTLVSINWIGFGISAETWAITMIATALLITILIMLTRKDFAYGLVVIWALLGISVKQSSIQEIVVVTQVSVIILAVTLVSTLLLSRLKRQSLYTLY